MYAFLLQRLEPSIVWEGGDGGLTLILKRSSQRLGGWQNVIEGEYGEQIAGKEVRQENVMVFSEDMFQNVIEGD